MPPAFETRFQGPEHSPGFLLWQVTNLWQRKQRAALKALGLTHVQFVLLASLAWLEHDGAAVSQVQLAQQAQTDLMMTSQVVRTLQVKGLIERNRQPHDSRANALTLTATGSTLIRRALPVVETVDEEFFSALKEGRSELVDLLRALLPEQEKEGRRT